MKLKLKIFITVVLVIILGCLVYAVNLYFPIKQAQEVPVLMYHNVVDKTTFNDKYRGKQYARVVITTDKFKQQMKFLKKYHYKALTLDEFNGFVTGKKRLPEKSVLITFDDGRKNVFVNAYPILKKYKFKATMFVITSKINSEPEQYNPDILQYLSKTDMKMGADVFEYASHTHNLHRKDDTNKPILKTNTYYNYEQIRNDIEESLKYVDKKYFAYPFGSGLRNNDLISALKDAGIINAFSTEKGLAKVGDDLYRIKRNNVCEATTHNKFKRILGLK